MESAATLVVSANAIPGLEPTEQDGLPILGNEMAPSVAASAPAVGLAAKPPPPPAPERAFADIFTSAADAAREKLAAARLAQLTHGVGLGSTEAGVAEGPEVETEEAFIASALPLLPTLGQSDSSGRRGSMTSATARLPWRPVKDPASSGRLPTPRPSCAPSLI